MEDYKFKLDAFEGPMDLLMHLIEKNKIDIYDIPIAELTRQYLDYLDKFREFNMEIASSFLVMAATLLQIKSRMMLPKTKQEETAEEEDPRLELVQRILEYRKFKQVSQVLGDMAYKLAGLERYSFLILIVLLMTPVLSMILIPCRNLIWQIFRLLLSPFI